ncbi:MAG: S8 family serine peptidase [Armatimonadetes bacterium]|nr:S8 family serine peptidase [Armatimonadota bacterium]
MQVQSIGGQRPLPSAAVKPSHAAAEPKDTVSFDIDRVRRETEAEARSIDSKLPEHLEGEALVKLEPGLSSADLDQFAQALGARILHRFDIPPELAADFQGELVHLALPEGMTTSQGIAAIEKHPLVVYAESNDVLTGTERRVPDDLDPSLWGLEKIEAPEAWTQTIGSRTGPVIAIIDSGIDYDHPDLARNVWTNPREQANGKDDDGNGVADDLHGYNTIRDSGDPMDDNDHGSHVAGTIAAVGNNGRGVVGVNWESRLMGLKFLAANGKGSTSNAVKAILYASRQGARITNNSWGSKGGWGNRALEDALRSSPALHIVAAGNDAEDIDEEPHYPGAFELPNLITVASTDSQDQLSSFSNFGFQRVQLAAPGSGIYSTVPGGGYGTMSGTSMATPHVAGVAGLLASKFPRATNQELRDRLLGSADVLPQLQGYVTTGGRLNARRALEQDGVAPAPVDGLRASRVTSGEVELSWVAPGDDGLEGRASGYELRFSNEPLTEQNFDQARRMPTGAPAAAGQPDTRRGMLFPSSAARTIYFGLKAYDNVGNRSALRSLAVPVPAARVAFEDDMDGFFNSWTGEANWARTSVPGRGKVWTDSPDGEYTNGAQSSLVSPEIDLRQVRGSEVTFDARYDLERGYDKVHVEATSNGSDWAELGQLSGRRNWDRHRYDLSRFDGQKIRLRFRLEADASMARDGFYLDRLMVAGR